MIFGKTALARVRLEGGAVRGLIFAGGEQLVVAHHWPGRTRVAARNVGVPMTALNFTRNEPETRAWGVELAEFGVENVDKAAHLAFGRLPSCSLVGVGSRRDMTLGIVVGVV